MIPLFDINEVNDFSTDHLFQLKCEHCHTIFTKTKHDIQIALSPSNSKRNTFRFCSQKCKHLFYTTAIECECGHCHKKVMRTPSHLKQIKNAFCSKSCAASYNNTHKTTGSRRSKLELWLKTKLSELYPSLEILYCDKQTVNAELDIYVPSLKLAFEINGIYHYEPIYGKDKFLQIQNNDNRKFQACLERDIELVIIDASSLTYFKERNCQKYLDIIKKIISDKLKRGGDSNSPTQGL